MARFARRAWFEGFVQRKGSLSGKMFAWCILQRRFAGHFEYMGSISCQSQLILDAWRRYLAAKGRFSCPGLLRECIRAIFCQECDPSPVRERASKMLRLGPVGCAGERKMIIVLLLCPRQLAPSVSWGSGRCCAVGFRVLVSPLTRMAAERAEHEQAQVQMQVQVRARMPLPPRRCRVWRAARLSRAAWR